MKRERVIPVGEIGGCSISVVERREVRVHASPRGLWVDVSMSSIAVVVSSDAGQRVLEVGESDGCGDLH